MTYYSEEEAYRYEAEAAWEADCDLWDEMQPGWEIDEIDPEYRHDVDYSDVLDPDEAVVRPPEWYFIPSADGLY